MTEAMFQTDCMTFGSRKDKDLMIYNITETVYI